MHRVLFLNNFRWYARWPLKLAIFSVCVLAVCFPNPTRLIRHLQHWRNPNALIEPDAAALQPWVDELRPALAKQNDPRKALRIVEKFVLEHIPYQWDWENWGNADYMPTVAEILEKGSEDCDGRAVVAASLLNNFGYDARIVTDFSHVWVTTKHGETMGPGKHKAIIADKEGLKVTSAAIMELPKALAYGIAPFPIGRELIILAVFWWLMLRRRGGLLCSLSSLAFLLNGLVLMRLGGRNYYEPVVWLQCLGLANSLAGAAGLLLVASANARKAELKVEG